MFFTHNFAPSLTSVFLEDYLANSGHVLLIQKHAQRIICEVLLIAYRIHFGGVSYIVNVEKFWNFFEIEILN